MSILIPSTSMFVQSIANSISLGSLYALVAIGYTMVYGILRLINFAHGDIFMMSMYFAFYFISLFHMPWYIAFIMAVAGIALLGILIERVAYKPLREAPRISSLISAIGVSYLLENLAVVCFSGVPKNFPEVPLLQNYVEIFGIKIQILSFVVPIITFVLVAALLTLIDKTKTGIAMRSCSFDFETSRLMGINVDNIIMLTFCIGSMLAAVGAIMWGLKFPKIEPYVGVMPGEKCFIAAVIGGIGNIKGAVLGGFLLGFLEIMLVLFFPALSGYKDAFSFVLLIFVLLFMPTGILKEKIITKV